MGEEIMKKTLYLMRHGQTLFNLKKMVQGWCDSPLTELGITQAKTAKQYFEDNNIVFDYAYSSTAERACDTLECITDLPYKRIKGLKEWNFGMFEGEPEYLNPSLPYGDFFVQYGGEAEMDMRNRVSEALVEIMKNDDHKNVLAVSHGAACMGFIRKWAHTSNVTPQGHLGNCCILKFEFENNEFKLKEIVNPNL